MLKKLKSVTMVIVFCLIVTAMAPMAKVQAAASKEKSIVAVVDDETQYYSFKFKVKKSTKMKLSVKILNISDETDSIVSYWGYCQTNISKGAIFDNIKKSKFKKGNTLICTDWEKWNDGLKKGTATFPLPEGVKRMKIKITISAVDGTKSIKSFKKIKKPYWM